MSELLITNLLVYFTAGVKRVNLSRCSEEFIYTNIVGDMRESNDSINDILL